MISPLKRRTVRRAAIALTLAAILTFYGFLNYWQGIEAPNARNHVLAIALLLPIAGLSTLFRAISADGHLSPLSYRLVLVIGSAGQLLYFYLFVLILERLVTFVVKSQRQQEPENRSQMDGDLESSSRS